MTIKRIRGYVIKCGDCKQYRVFVDVEDVFRELVEERVYDAVDLEVRRATLIISDIVDVLESMGRK